MKKFVEVPLLNRKIFPNLVIVGSTASGKSSVSYQLAKLLGLGIIDLDSWMEAKEGQSIADIFAERGEEGFRELETATIRGLGNILNHIIIPGGGALEKDENWQLLRQLGPSICLATPQSEVVYRLLKDPEELRKRPLLAPALEIADAGQRRDFLESRLNELDERRLRRYKEADYAVTISFATPVTCARFIKEILLSRQTPHNM